MRRAKIGWLIGVLGCVTATFAHAETSSLLTLDNTYQTDCIGLYEAFPADGQVLYYSKGWGENNYFSTLNLLTGECAKTASVPSRQFKVVAVSPKYVLANDGNYNRYSIYEKAGWRRLGSKRLADFPYLAAFDGDKLRLIQRNAKYQTVLTTFQLPDLTFVSERVLDVPEKAKAVTAPGGFIFFEGDYLKLNAVRLDYDGRTLKAGVFNMVDRERGCEDYVRPIGGSNLAVVGVGCRYFLLNIDTFERRYDLKVAVPMVSINGFRPSEKYLYLLERPSEHLENSAVSIRDLATGEEVARVPGFAVGGPDDVMQVGDHLVWPSWNREASRFDVRTYRMAH